MSFVTLCLSVTDEGNTTEREEEKRRIKMDRNELLFRYGCGRKMRGTGGRRQKKTKQKKEILISERRYEKNTMKVEKNKESQDGIAEKTN